MATIGASFAFSLCADDYAISPGVSRGIVEALEARRLSATSVMTTRPFWSAAAKELHPFRDLAEIGLHLNLTLGRPLGGMAKFAKSGQLPNIRSVVAAAQKRELPEAEIRDEIARQLDAFTEAFGEEPDFVDGHQHVQVLPGIRLWLFQTLEKRGLNGKIWLRDSADYLPRIFLRAIELKKALGIAWLARGFAREAVEHGFATNEGFAGFSAFDPKRDFGSDFEHYLQAPGRRHLVMCHPGHCDAELARVDPVTGTRETELEFLLSEKFTTMLKRRSARLAQLKDMAK
ncbi:MAG TPA: ChbG/HpnK family deacetylase [Beijerinckia sp.]|nr:ChbG/HpnK family deacetylase [Beijerinckia sp.]